MKRRGSHTTVIEQGEDICALFRQHDIPYAPGKIEVIRSASSRTLKYKKINKDLYEVVITAGSSKQTLKVFSTSLPELLASEAKGKVLDGWNIRYLDISNVKK